MNISGMGMPNMGSMQQLQRRMFKAADQDGSGGLSKAEFTSALDKAPARIGETVDADAAFAKLDGNEDGSLTSAEMQQSVKDVMLGFRSTMAAFAPGATAGAGAGSSSRVGASRELADRLLAQMRTQYDESATLVQADPLSMFA